MLESQTCPKCGAGIPTGALEGLCSKCLAGLAFGIAEAPGPQSAEGHHTAVMAPAVSIAPAPPALPRAASRSADTPARLFGDHELLNEIARGGMGVVFKARQVSLNRIVAVKMILSGEFASEAFVRRFRAEAEAAAHLHHPNIVAIHEVGEQNGQHYFSMDYVKGPSLAALVKDHPLPAIRAVEYLQKVARAIQYAHEQGILHRDLKPSNVLIGEDDEPRVMDFGLAKRLWNSEAGTADPELTLSGEVLGSPGYLPPEQAAGRRGTVGPQSDVYSLGAILYHLLTGRPPFVGESVQDTLAQVLNSEPIAPRLLNPRVPRDLEIICLKCLEKNAPRRYGSALELADELGRFLRHEPIRARPVGAPERMWRWCRRRPALAAAIALLAIVATGSTTTAVRMARLERTARWEAYATDVNHAQSEWQDENHAQAFFYLQKHVPRGLGPDLRGFEWRHLWKLTRGNYSFKLPRQPQVVGSLMFSPDGKSLAAFRWDTSDPLKVWDLTSRRERFRIAEATSLGGFSSNGKWFVAGAADGTVNVYDAETGKLLFAIPRAGEIVAFAADGNCVATINPSRTVTVLKLETQHSTPVVTNFTRRYFDYGKGAPLALAPDGSGLAVIRPGAATDREDSGIDVWDTVTQSLRTFLHDKHEIRTMQFSPDGRVLAVGDGDGRVRLWNLASGEPREFQAHDLPILCLAFSPDGRTLATGSADESIQLWEVATSGQKLKRFDGQIGSVWSLAFSADGKFLATGSRDSPIRFWDLEAADPADEIRDLKSEKVGNFTFSPDGSLMAGGCRDDTVRIWDVRTMSERFRLKNASYVVAFTSDGRKLLASTADGIAQWWDFRADTTQSLPQYGSLGQVTSVDLSSDRRVAALGWSTGGIQLLEIDSGKVLGTYHGHSDAVLCVTFSPDPTLFASGSRDKTIRVWNSRQPDKPLQVCAEHRGAVGGLAISGDGKTMVSGCSANTIKFWDLRHLKKTSLASISWHQSAVRTLAFSPDSRTLASGSEDKAVKLWDLASRSQLASFRFDDAIRLVAFSADGNNLAVVTDKGTLRLLRTVPLAEADEEFRTFYSAGAK